jgi:hypothetical protein
MYILLHETLKHISLAPQTVNVLLRVLHLILLILLNYLMLVDKLCRLVKYLSIELLSCTLKIIDDELSYFYCSALSRLEIKCCLLEM